MADSFYEDDLDQLLALAKLAQRHAGDAEYASDEELDVFGTDRIGVEPILTMAPHSTRSGPGDWVSEDMDLVAPEHREAHEKKKEERKRKEEQPVKQPERKKVKTDIKMGGKVEATAGEAKAKTGLPGEQAPWRVAPAQTPSTAVPAAPEPPSRRGQLLDINEVQPGAAPAPVLPQATETAPQAFGQQLTSGTYRQLQPAPLFSHPPPASAPYPQQQLGFQLPSGAYPQHLLAPLPTPPSPVPAPYHQGRLGNQLILGAPHQLPPALRPQPQPLPPTPTPSPEPPTQAQPSNARSINIEKAILSILENNSGAYIDVVQAIAAARNEPGLPVVFNAILNGRATRQQQTTFHNFVKAVETKWLWGQRGGPDRGRESTAGR
jgi:hypothetical protein